MANIPWTNSIPGSPLRLRAATSEEPLAGADVPATVLRSSPDGCVWFAGARRRWFATIGARGPDEALARFDGERWFDTGVRTPGWCCPDADGRLLVGRNTLIDVGDSARALLVSEQRIDASAYLGDAIVLLTAGRLTRVRGDEVRSWSFAHETIAARAVDGALLIDERIAVDGPPYEKDIIHVVVFVGDEAYRVGRFASTEAAGEWEHGMCIDVEYIGPFEGPYASLHKGTPLTGPMVTSDGNPLIIDGLAEAVAAAASFERLESAEPLPLSFDVPPPIDPTPLEPRRLELGTPDLASLGPLSTWLIGKMQALGRRPQPDPDVLALLAHPMPADLFAFLHTWAHYRVSVVFDSIDWWVDAKPQRVTGWLAGSAPIAIQIGTMGSGDPYVVQLFDSGRARFTNFDDEGSEYFTASSLEGLLHNLRSEAHVHGKTTLLDDL